MSTTITSPPKPPPRDRSICVECGQLAKHTREYSGRCENCWAKMVAKWAWTSPRYWTRLSLRG